MESAHDANTRVIETQKMEIKQLRKQLQKEHGPGESRDDL